ncbi:MAG: hypothetical protein K0R29_1587 [Pseudobdellovibrio sp.]|nr:hypothetical protein [Pseudobdellovibrio sp.]
MGKPTLTGILRLINKRKKQTTGSETSQYRQENKSKEISLVVASERETGQTQIIFDLGVVGLQCGSRFC